MKRLNYAFIILLTLAIWLSSCKTSRNLEMQKQIDYSGIFVFAKFN